MNSYHFACIIQYIVVGVTSCVVGCRKTDYAHGGLKFEWYAHVSM